MLEVDQMDHAAKNRTREQCLILSQHKEWPIPDVCWLLKCRVHGFHMVDCGLYRIAGVARDFCRVKY